MPTLEFKGKQYIYSHHHSVPFRELLINEKKSFPAHGKKPSLDDNLIIHGDNLHALKALMPHYAGKIKCIYIDPPYNTGNEGWCYNDNVNSPLMKDWISKNANPVDKEDMQRHDKWLCMMYPRLKLLHELLSDDGVIFVSIDDNELYNLRCVLDEVFSDQNWVGTIVWKNATDNNPTNISVEHEYVLCFSKKKDSLVNIWKSAKSDIKNKLIEIGTQLVKEHKEQSLLQKAYTDWFRVNKPYLSTLDRYKYIDNGGVYTGSQSVHNPGREGYRYDVIHPTTKKACKQPLMGYRFPKETMEKLIEEGKILFGEDEDKIIELKVYAFQYEDKLPSLISLDGRLGAYEFKSILHDSKKFDNPKPSQFIKQILAYVLGKDDLILDSFAGSGTTAHAVLDLNKEDGGNRKFILVEMEDYADPITAERVRRVIKGVPTAKDEKLKAGLGGSFTFCELGKEISIEKIITGESLPDYGALAQYVFYTATGKSLEKQTTQRPDYFVGETDLYEVYLIYKPDIAFLRCNDSALNDTKLQAIAARNSKKEKLVFATAKYMGQKELSSQNITFCQLPYAIHKVVGG
ncbi:site-specific DNA-methyltransferase [Candidatus Methylospira mobilis]|uniref:site-specific DNA-methyltransferase (adenine-specific) n=1 Tax=Candidatus Methylospira mobilis TaxID=1808979 RepID=A0A5Q0BKM9_9GAMM|nr:site-specific DNA-methyltransferase [Candidatus Methylospira mobilis]QFY42678.1 site-specific DNA-methyltransferase [Candidatus Methylospira mobilis]